MNKTLIVVRHAHRHILESAMDDNGLSERGREQARRVAAFYSSRFGSVTDPWVVSSPKQRCMETLEPLVAALQRDIEQSALLDEGGDLEAHAAEFLEAWEKSASPLTIACSHGDWIPVFLELATGQAIALNKGGWAELELEDGQIRLSWLIQDLAEAGARGQI